MKVNPVLDNPARRGAFLSFAWIASVILAGALLWFFTQPVRTGVLVRAANRIIARTGETRRLRMPAGRAAGLGTWFTLAEVSGSPAEGSVLVFTLLRGAQTAACAAFVDGRGGFEKFVPLGDYAAQVMDDLPEAVYAVYRERIVRAQENRQ
ncbi:MAG: hypothetical protein LBP69_00130 [Treponema sp.]|jgi:hypothetical protein|nr:hypothetical protein [Treponema sp.]